MHVWLVNHYALPPSEPGGTRHYALARYLMRRGHDVTIIASSVNHSTRKQRNDSMKPYTVEEINGVRFLWLRVPVYRNNVSRLWNMLVFALKLWSGAGTRKLHKPDVVVGSSLTLFAALAAERLARRESVPFILEIRDLWPQSLIDMGMSPHHPAVTMFGLIESYLYRHADKIVTLLPRAADHMVPKGALAENITWIPNGVDLNLMPFPCAPSARDVFTVVYTGSHGTADMLDPVLDAAVILNQNAPGRFSFHFIGDGPRKQHLCERARTEKIGNVVFHNPVAKDQVFQHLQNADAFVISMKRTTLYRYGISLNKIHDYMAAGRPIVFAGDSTNNPVADASAGITVEPEDSKAIAQAFLELAATPIDKRWDMGLRARAYVEKNHDFAVLSLRLEHVILSAFKELPNAKPEIRTGCSAA